MSHDCSDTITLYHEDVTELVQGLDQSFKARVRSKSKKQKEALKKRLTICFEGEPEMLKRALAAMV